MANSGSLGSVAPGIDLHLADNALTRAHVIDKAVRLSKGLTDWDGQRRPNRPDIGADEFFATLAANSASVNGAARDAQGPPLTSTVQAVDFAYLLDLGLDADDNLGKGWGRRGKR